MAEESQESEAFADAWDAVIADMDATTEEYREAGWDALELHPGDVTAREGPDRYGFDVLVPDDEYERLEAFVADTAFDATEVFRAADAGRVFALVAVVAAAAERAVLFPVFFEQGGTDDLRAHATEADELDARIRPLADDRGVTFTCEEPSLFFPDDAAGSTDSDGTTDA